MTLTLHPLAEDYLARLYRLAQYLPDDRREELVSEIEDHLLDALGKDASEVDVRNVLERLGSPEEILDAESPRPVPAAPGSRRGMHEWFAVGLVAFGAFIFGLGWIFGLILLWGSRAWTTVDKWIGTIVVSAWSLLAGLVLVNWANSAGYAGAEPAAILFVTATGPLLVACYLAARADLNR